MRDEGADSATDYELASLVRTSYATGVRRSTSLLPHYDGIEGVREALIGSGVTDIVLRDGSPRHQCAHATRSGRPIAYLDWTLVRDDDYRDPFFPA